MAIATGNTINNNWCRLACHGTVSCNLARDFAASAADFPAVADFADAAALGPAVEKVVTFAGDTRRLQVPLFVAVEA